MQVPERPSQVEFGVGIDLPPRKDPRIGDDARGDTISACVDAFLARHADELGRLFVCWQPHDSSWLAGLDPPSTYDELFERMAPFVTAQALHHGALNLATLERYERDDMIGLANALVERHAFSWLNEDVALGSIGGKPLPYPLPPYLTDEGLAAAIENTKRVSGNLEAPMLIEFPGFADGAAFFIGPIHAYDFFRMVAVGADVAVTLDVGHLLSYQWLLGRRGVDLYRELDRLPLDRCFEIRLSGCEIAGGRFYGRHHGMLIDEEIELLARLLDRCANARAVTYEEPLFATERAEGDGTAALASKVRDIVLARSER
jgi:uncharacterized protein (UPF0276 family)